MAEAGDETAAAGAGGGRDQVLAALKNAFAQGRLTKEEFEQRVGQVLAIHAELDALTADIPAGEPAAVTPDQQPVQPAADGNKKMMQRGTAIGAGFTFLLAAGVVTPQNPVLGVVLAVVLGSVVGVLLAGFLTLLSWAFDRRSAGQSTRGPQSRHRPRGAGQEGITGIGQDPPHAVQATRRRRGPHRASRLQSRPAVLTW